MARRLQLLGAMVQGLTLGALLFLALIELASLATGAALFRYQGF